MLARMDAIRARALLARAPGLSAEHLRALMLAAGGEPDGGGGAWGVGAPGGAVGGPGLVRFSPQRRGGPGGGLGAGGAVVWESPPPPAPLRQPSPRRTRITGGLALGRVGVGAARH